MSITLATHSVASLLKTETAQHHAETENYLVPHLKQIQTTADYAAILRMFYGFFKPLEEQIAGVISTDFLPDISSRKKAHLAEQDLQRLADQAGEELSIAKSLPSINNLRQAFGALYVLEGSTLGGRYIAKMLAKNQANLPAAAMSFFEGYGEATGPMWLAFQQKLNEFTPEETPEIIAAANETFIKMKAWMQTQLP